MSTTALQSRLSGGNQIDPTADLVPLRQAAQVLGMSPERTLRRIAARQLAGKNIGGKWYVTSEALASALAEQTVAP